MFHKLAGGKLLGEVVQKMDENMLDVRVIHEVKLSGKKADEAKRKRAMKENATLLIESLQAAGLETPDVETEMLSSVSNESLESWRKLGWAICQLSLQKAIRDDKDAEFWRDIGGVSKSGAALGTSERLQKWVRWRTQDSKKGNIWRKDEWRTASHQSRIASSINDWKPATEDNATLKKLLGASDRPKVIGEEVKGKESKLAILFTQKGMNSETSLPAVTRSEINSAYSALMYSIWRKNGGKEDPEINRESSDPKASAMEVAKAATGREGDSQRLESQLRNWVNRLLSYKGKRRVQSLFSAVRDGLLLLRVLDCLSPGIVDWKKVEMTPKNKFARLTNNNLGVTTATKPPFSFSLVGIAGEDLEHGNEKLTLALVWQLMRYQLFQNLNALLDGDSQGDTKKASSSKEGKQKTHKKGFSEKTLLSHANAAIQAAIETDKPQGPSGDAKSWVLSQPQLKSFSDEHLNKSHYLALLIWAATEAEVPWDLLEVGSTASERASNARLVISLARRQGATVYITPLDITELKTDMIFTLLAAILGLSTKN